MKQFFKDFKSFAMRGNVIELAVGVMIGGAFGKIVSSLVNDIFMPIISLLIGGINLSGQFFALNGKSYATIEEANAAGVGTINYGMFIQTILDFLIIAFFIFLFIRLIEKAFKKEEVKPTPKRKCPYCFSEIDEKATRCPHCTSQLSLKE